MSKLNNILKNTLIFLAIFLSINYLLQSCQTNEDHIAKSAGNINILTTKTEYSRYQTVTVKIQNSSLAPITIPDRCPAEPLKVYKYEDAEWEQKSISPNLSCEDSKDIILEPGEEILIPYDNWNFALFSDMGRFRIELPLTIDEEEKVYTTNEFLVVKEGIIRQIAIGVFYRPIYNGLIFLTSVVPFNDLGLAIIILTLIIRTILLIPSHRAMQSQKRMQTIQPKLEKIKEKYKGDQQKIATETMAVWKEAKINPMGSCLPLLLQLPFLITLFYVIQSGLNPDKSYLLYMEYSNFGIENINASFFGLMNLTKPNIYVLPLIVGGLQFLQMHMMMANKPQTKSKNGKGNEMAMASNIMTYVMPVMIAVFTASLPAGVGLYWGTSTLYGIGQQFFINKSPEKESNEPTVKVIPPKSK
jgi:YidC/Oxa1 family membrane protein insertase